MDPVTDSAMTETTTGRLVVVVAARHPTRPEDLGLGQGEHVARVRLVRRTGALAAVIDELDPDLVVVDTGFPEGHGFEAIEAALTAAPDAAVLALTPSPPPYADVARATRAGAAGFVDVDAEPEEIAEAVRAVAGGGTWFPTDEVRPVLAAVAGDLDTTEAERRSRLTNILLGLIPLTGILAAFMTFLWRKYLGQIGVRPVDLAVDPASRIIDAIAGLLLVVGVFGPLLLVGTWLELLRGTPLAQGPVGSLLRHRKLAYVVGAIAWLAVAYFLALGADVGLVLVAGPLVTVAVIAGAADLSDQLPEFLRIRIRPRPMLIGAVTGVLAVLVLVGAEVMMLGPDLGVRGEGGIVAPHVLGFNAQPMLAIQVDGEREPREVLYLGGNADLYVLVDPCDDDAVDLVSVGSHRLVVIDEITCTASGTASGEE